MTRIKICGITTPGDARGAAEAGADAIGLVFADSPRHVNEANARLIVAALPAFVTTFGVFMDHPLEEVVETARAIRIDAVQLHGEESPAYCRTLRRQLGGRATIVKRIPVGPHDTRPLVYKRIARHTGETLLFDPGAGSGRTFRWELVVGLRRPFILSGGLAPHNVADAVRQTRPFAVDVSSGVEKRPGRKDMAKVRAFIQAVRAADADGVTG